MNNKRQKMMLIDYYPHVAEDIKKTNDNFLKNYSQICDMINKTHVDFLNKEKAYNQIINVPEIEQTETYKVYKEIKEKFDEMVKINYNIKLHNDLIVHVMDILAIPGRFSSMYEYYLTKIKFPVISKTNFITLLSDITEIEQINRFDEHNFKIITRELENADNLIILFKHIARNLKISMSKIDTKFGKYQLVLQL